MRGTIPSLPKYAFVAWCLVKLKDNFAFYLYHIERRALIGEPDNGNADKFGRNLTADSSEPWIANSGKSETIPT
jgi:hypothetical protein